MSKENEMGTMPIGKLLMKMSLPIVVSMLIQALYNVVDSRYVSLISEEAFAAVSMAFPIQNLIIGLGVGTGVGINAFLSKSLGEKNKKAVNLTAQNGLFISIIHYLIFLIFGLFLPRIFFVSQSTNLKIVEYGSQYLSVISIFSLGVFVQITCEKLLQSTGRAILSMICQLTGAVINILLDPIFIFGLYGVPKYGVKGAAIATVIGQSIGAVVGFFLNFKYNKEIDLTGFKFDFEIIKKIYEVGIPSFVLISITSVTVYFFNRILASFSTTTVAAYGAFYKMQSFVLMAIFGLNNGMVPVLAYNYGAGNIDRSKDIIKLSLKLGNIFMALGFLVFQIFPKQLLSFFDASNHLIQVGVPALRYISIAFLFAGYTIISGAIFQALGNGVLSLMSSIIRQLVVLLPVAYIFGKMNNLTMVWLSYPIAEFFDFLYCKYYIKKFAIKKIEANINKVQ